MQELSKKHLLEVSAPNEIRALGHGVRSADTLIEKVMRQFNLFEGISQKLSSVFAKRNNFNENERWIRGSNGGKWGG